MPNTIFRDQFRNHIQRVLGSAKSAGLLNHPGMTGRAREIFVKDLLKPILPPYVVLGSGKIGDSEDRLSSEVDVVVYSASTLPPLLLEESFGVFPAEACIYAIEVKSKLTAEQLKDAIDKHRQLQNLRYLPSACNQLAQPIANPSPPVIPVLFAFGSDLTDKEELERYRELDTQADTHPVIPVICIAGRGYWWFKPSEPAEKWMYHFPGDNEEIIDFLAGISNTIPDQVALKGRPRFGNYILKPREFQKL